MDARNSFVRTVYEIALAACGAGEVVTAMPADADAVALLPGGHPRPWFVHYARNLMAGNARILNARERAVFHKMVAEANAASLHFNAHLPGPGLWNFALNNFKIAARFGNLHYFHFRHWGIRLSNEMGVLLGCNVAWTRYRLLAI